MECYIDPEQESLFSDQLRKAEGALRFCDDKFPVTSIGIMGQNRSDFANVLFKKFSRHFSASCLLSNVLEHAKNPEGLRELQTRLYSELMPRSNGHPPSIYNTDRGRDLLLDRLKNMKSFIVLDDIGDDMQQLRSLLILDKHRLGKGSRMVLTSRYPHVLDNMAKADVVIDVSTTIKEDTFRDSFKRLVICCESEDVDVGFIKHLMESFSMLGLYVSLTKGNEILDVAHDVQSAMVLVILSRGFNIESPHVRSTLSEVNTLLGDKVLYISYGQQQLPAIQLDANSSGEQRALYRTISRRGLTFSPNFQDLTSGLETGKFKSLVNDILERMNHTCKFRAFTDYPVALIERQQRIENEISECLTKRKQSQYFGIVGMGGMGKTTVAMSLFNKFHNKFEGSVFLENIRAQASRGSSALGSLQKLILCTVLGGEYKEVNIMSVQEGKSFLSSKLRGTNTLIILDDVDNTEQLKSLLDPLDLGTGSVVVITSRDRGLLTLHKVNMIFELDLLREEDAQSLFYWHAFLKPSPPLALKGIAEQLVNACQGLPLSLQVIGAHVFGHVDPDFWNETLNYIKNAGKEIFDLLRVTVDALEDYQREAFLDVCCFLVGMSQQTAQRVWNGCGLDAKTCIYVLKSKCLMTVDPKHDVIRMHDQIRDMGRYIAKQRRPRTHIWDVQLDVPDSALGSQDLHGLAWIARDEDDAQLSGCVLESLCHAKILLLQNVKIEEDFPDKCYYNGLRWLQWLRSPFISLPRGLCRRNLRVLDLSGSTHLTTLLAEGDSTLFKELRRLQELNLSDCKSLRELPPLQFLSSLEWLSLKGCEHVQNLDSGIGTLTRLRFLDLRQCKALQYLPSEIRCLGLLEKLFLSDCVSLEYLPEGLGECINLTELYLDHTGLTTLTESLCMLENLEVMIVSGCHKLACLPENFGNLRSLRICNFKDCSKLRQLPYTFCELKKMEELNLSSCDLHELPEAIGNLCKLKSLVLFNNPSLRRLPPSIGALSSLKVLDMHSCPLQDDGITEGLRNMQNLEEMILQDTNLCKVPSCLEHLHKLHTLNLRGCKDLEEASFFPSSLRILDISQCPCLRSLNNLDAAKSLWRLFASNCYELRTINGLDGPTRLELLDIAGCKRLYTTAARGLEGSNIRQFCLSGSHVLPSPKLLQLPDLGYITYFGSKLPSPFTNSILSEANNEEHANILLMSIDTAFSTGCNAKSCDVAMVMCFVSHDQGWSDFPKEYSSYTLSPTFVEAVLYRQGWKVGPVQLLYRNRHAEIRDQAEGRGGGRDTNEAY
ncbi:hypothetical protein KP509_16G018600 [Ceratopteris richardii]|uniref:Uncharacterized protein n=1 Tax=Ceratopteris richardii TaxID=49495 RepID=A0A8T2SXW0_CERRI|nr:hypothetical protein KP509_16G018600 [Ceratopteris richardii]